MCREQKFIYMAQFRHVLAGQKSLKWKYFIASSFFPTPFNAYLSTLKLRYVIVTLRTNYSLNAGDWNVQFRISFNQGPFFLENFSSHHVTMSP